MSNLQDLKTEILTDPLGRGYVGMTDAQVAVSLLTKDRTKERATMTAADIYEAIDRAEYTALVSGEKTEVNILLGLGGAISIVTGSKARAVLLAAFPGGSATRTALIAAAVESISRAEELFEGAHYGFRMVEEAVTAARALT
jgi:hypothetical protein